MPRRGINSRRVFFFLSLSPSLSGLIPISFFNESRSLRPLICVQCQRYAWSNGVSLVTCFRRHSVPSFFFLTRRSKGGRQSLSRCQKYGNDQDRTFRYYWIYDVTSCQKWDWRVKTVNRTTGYYSWITIAVVTKKNSSSEGENKTS
jgi:hypothetical protein